MARLAARNRLRASWGRRATDISPEQLIRERALLADAEELAGAGSFAWEQATGAVHWSPGMYRIHGRRPRGELTLEQADNVDPRDSERVHGALRDALAGDAALLELTYRIVRPDGGIRWIETRNRIERDAQGQAVRMIGVSVDVTERRESERLREEAQRTSRERERLLRSVIDNNRALIYVKDLEGRYVLYNARFAEVFELERRAVSEGASADTVLLGRDDHWLDPARAPVWPFPESVPKVGSDAGFEGVGVLQGL